MSNESIFPRRKQRWPTVFGTVVSQPNFWMNYGDRGPY